MVGLILVSHSKKLAEAVREMVLQMTAPDFPIAVAGGVGDTHDELGTDAVHISEVLQQLSRPEGLLVFMDLGSAVLSAETALELLEATCPVRLCPAPLVEGAIAAAVRAQAGGNLEEVAQEAELGLVPKREQLGVQTAAQHLPEATQHVTASPGQTAELVLDIQNLHGLHARPAAALVRTASRFSCSVEIANLTAQRGPASARSLTSISLLNVRRGDRIQVVCSGSDCHDALEAIRDLASAGFGEKLGVEPIAVAAPSVLQSSEAAGFPGSEGIAIGPLIALEAAEIAIDDAPSGNPAAEIAELTRAMNTVRDQLLQANSKSENNAILEAQALILSDPAVVQKLQSAVKDSKVSGVRAWSDVVRELAAQYESMDDGYLRERAADIRDIGQRVLRQIKGIDSHPPIRPVPPAIVFADELLPSEASVCDPEHVLGVITAKGSATSHAAILTRTLGIPMVVGARGIGPADSGKTVAMNGSTGECWIDPDEATAARLTKLQQSQLQHKQRTQQARTEPSTTLDGVRMEVLANVGNARDSQMAAESGAEGVGLLRTEFLFLSRKAAPTEDEQVRALREICEPISGPIIIRTLDVGADKPLSFLPQPEEHNPYLGLRGIRLSLRSPELFLAHIRAILRAGVGHEIWLMFPMIAQLVEVRQALEFLDEAHRQLHALEIAHAWPIQRGVMIEVPSAALLAEQLAEDLDFFSIGTNDLTQYTLAAERGNASVSHLQDALHPAVLRLIKSVVGGAATRHRHVSVCGDAASDPVAAAVFAGLGIRSLSVRPNQCAQIKALFRQLRIGHLQELAVQALSMSDAREVRHLLDIHLAAASAAD